MCKCVFVSVFVPYMRMCVVSLCAPACSFQESYGKKANNIVKGEFKCHWCECVVCVPVRKGGGSHLSLSSHTHTLPHSVAAASILAHGARACELAKLDIAYPGYDFLKSLANPNGIAHAAVAAHGPSPVHRVKVAALPPFRG